MKQVVSVAKGQLSRWEYPNLPTRFRNWPALSASYTYTPRLTGQFMIQMFSNTSQKCSVHAELKTNTTFRKTRKNLLLFWMIACFRLDNNLCKILGIVSRFYFQFFLSNFNFFLFPLKSPENLDDFKRNKSWWIRLNLLNITGKIWRLRRLKVIVKSYC